jgi:thiosulfate/3-mercaptopyruvate sulfurtransferase
VRIIVYDRVGIFSAPRVWWTFRVMGHDDVAVLDGGLPAWEAAGYAVDREPPRAPRERHFTSHYRGDLVRDLDDVRRAAAAGKPILDARPQARFRGEAPEPRAGLRSGHIPGSANLPSASLLTDDGRLLPTPALRQALGPYLEGERPITTCGSGVSAAIIALALAAVGRTDAAIYDGSWSEWGARADTPIATDVESGA